MCFLSNLNIEMIQPINFVSFMNTNIDLFYIIVNMVVDGILM